ncbi:MAG TPA: hypothetical protein VMZ04_02670 [Anaerolineae bacterium]|nr:hypothetical protein [Anaerolineae bacterium]
MRKSEPVKPRKDDVSGFNQEQSCQRMAAIMSSSDSQSTPRWFVCRKDIDS